MEQQKLHIKGKKLTYVIKILTLALAVLAQIAVIVIPSVFFGKYMGPIKWILEILSILVVLYLVRSDINPVYKIPWIILLLLVPVFGGIVYIIYGRAHFGKKELKKMHNASEMARAAIVSKPYYNDELREENRNISVQADYLFRCAEAPVYKNTTSRYFPLGDDMFPVLLEELRKAKKYIFMEYFIVQEGKMLNPILEILEEKVKEGVEVRFMYDSFGSILKTPGDFVRSMRKKGIQCYEFNCFRSILDSRYNNRDHRKICVIDGEVGFTGGVNLADEYINTRTIYGQWKDTAIMIKGEAVWSLVIMFLSLWDVTTKQTDDFSQYAPDKEFHYDDGYVAPYTDYPLDDEPVGKNVYLNMIHRANHYIYIMTPYLILDNVLAAALSDAAKNGIDVRIITPGIPDKKLAFMLTQSYYECLIKAGVRIFEYDPGFVHAKIFLSDDETAVVGTINLDYRSLTHHFENAIWMYNNNVIWDIKQDYFNTLEKCHEVSYQDSRKKTVLEHILLPILRLISPLF